MLDHVGIKVRNIEASRRFYTDTLQALGYGLVAEFDDYLGFGVTGKPSFWVSPAAPTGPTHVAFVAGNRAAVDAFYKAALAAGGRDNGAPGLRADYHPNYYGAFVFDPDGNNIEAVCHQAA